MMTRSSLTFFAGLAALILAFAIQFLLASAGLHFNIILAALITFGYIFTLSELAVFLALSILVLNWQPAPSVTLLIFAVIPLAAHFFRKSIRWELWVGNGIAVLAGFLFFYLALAPAMFIANIPHFFADTAIGLLVGEGIFFTLT